MLSSFKRSVTGKYKFTEEKLTAFIKDLRIEVKQEYESRIHELENKISKQAEYISKLEKDYGNTVIKADILTKKLEEKELQDKKVLSEASKRMNKSLASEIFGE